jgi:sigma-B regulation protein RsbU (phosphoserine phosphatase)
MAGLIDLDTLLGVILARATEALEAERASIFIYEEATQTLWNRVSGDLARGQVRVPLGSGIVGHVARAGALVNIADAYADPRFNPEVDKETGFRTRSLLSAPMTGHDGRLAGVIQVLNKTHGRAFTGDDESFLEAFASHAAVALDRARLVQAYGEKQRIEEALRLAHDIQMAMLPGEPPGEGPFALAAELVPARSVGGDLYDFFVDRGRLWFLVGDVAGKGVGPALFMAVAETLFRASVQGDTPLGAVFSRMNRELCRKSSGAMFVTVFAGCLDLATGELVTGNAGHNPPYRLTRDGSVAKVTEPRGVPFGILDSYEYQTGRLRLLPGDGLFAYTDGVTDAMNEREESYGTRRLEGYLSGAAGASPAEIVSGALRAVRAFEHGIAQYDDITLLALRYLGSG